MSVRVTTDSMKIAYVFISYLFGPMVLLLVGVTVGFSGLVPAYGVLVAGLVGFAVRTFRGDDEPRDPPRAWWRMTARPTSGFVFAAVFALPSLSLVLAPPSGADAWASFAMAAVNLLVAAMFVQSSVRLHRGRGDSPRTGTELGLT